MPEQGARNGARRSSTRWRWLAPLGLTLASVFLVSACGGDDDGGESSDPATSDSATAASVTAPQLDGRTFRSTAVTGHTLVPESTVELQFADGRIVARAGCNTLSGAATVGDGKLAVPAEGLVSTQIGCSPELQAQDEWLSALLTSAPSIALEGTTLRIGDDSNGMTLGEREDLPLLATAWVLSELTKSSADTNSGSSVPPGVKAGIRIDPDGTRMTIQAGCNSGSAKVAVKPEASAATGTIAVSAPATTRMMCEDDAMAVETQVLAVLDGTVSYRIEGEKLTLTNGANGLIFSGIAAPAS